MTPRTKTLRASLPKVRDLCLERAKLVTESYKETEGEWVCLRRAKALQRILEQMTIFITDGERLVGSLAAKRGATPIFPEFSLFILKDLEEVSKRPGYHLDPKDALVLKEILEYWEGKTVEDLAESDLGPQMASDWNRFVEAGVFANERRGSGIGLVVPGYDRVLHRGLGGFIDEADHAIQRPESLAGDREKGEKIAFLQAVKIACQGAIQFGRRYAEKGRELAPREPDAQRRSELERMAEICEKVPGRPAATFHEALQSLLFCQLIVQIESNGRSIGLGRFDQYMYPFYKRDLENGEITKEEARELLECFFIKLTEVDKVRPIAIAQATVGNMFQQLTIGGQTAGGKDGTNELTYLVLEAQESMKLIQPNISLRCHDGMPEELLHKGLALLRKGAGMPNFFNDRKKIDYLVRSGVNPEEAVDYGIAGCIIPVLPGKEDDLLSEGDLTTVKCFTLALNDGVDPMTGVRLGPSTGSPQTFRNLEDLRQAYRTQMRYFAEFLMQGGKSVRKAHVERAPCPFLSALIQDCIARGKSTRDGGARYSFAEFPHIIGQGIINVADSLAAIKKFVFEEKRIHLSDLVEVLKKNFEGREDLRQMLLCQAPKFGNDDDEVDRLASMLVEDHLACVEPRVSPTQHNLNAIAINVTRGKKVGATPDGRRAGEPFADGGVSPAQGRDLHGPTALLKSASKIKQKELAGPMLNQKLHPALLEGRENLKKVAALVKTYLYDLGGDMIQFNIVDNETLMAAQREPEKYADLIIRVSGFCAYFTQISKDLQDDLITRTVHPAL